MAKTRVSDLAKEYGMTSKEMLGHLQNMKIPAKSPSSTLEDAYVSIVRKKLKPILEARAAEIEAARKAEEEAAAKAAEEARIKAEQERIEAEKRREAERLEAERRRAEEEAARKAEEEARLAEERRAAEEAERNRVRDNAPHHQALHDEPARPDRPAGAHPQGAGREGGRARRRPRPAARAARAPAAARPAAPRRSASSAPSPRPDGCRREARAAGRQGPQEDRRGGEETEDRYSRMARAAEEYNRGHVLDEARAAIDEAARESQGRRKKRKERRKQQAEEAAEQRAIEEAKKNDQDLSQLDTVKVPQGSTVAELAELLGVPANDIIKRLFLLGTPLTMTQSMSDELIELVADDLGRDVKVMTKEEENSFTFYDDPDSLKPRSPVVTVMGHVDHGKTSLLDAIRHTGVAAGEAGGITQAIGASQVEINGRTITFIDTPGHETFTAMRARGAKVTDIVILVVAADDGVMPQTVESINHAKAAGVPIVVAVNKIDKDDANPDRVRQELTEYGVIPEEWGGQNMFVNISAKKKIGIDELLETVLLQADVLELKANPDTFASGYVLEAKLDRGRGSVASVLVNRGTLHVGDALVAGMSHGRVRAMLDQHGNPVTEAGPSDAVEILGLQSVPSAGDEFRVFQDERDARDLAEQRALKARIEEQNRVKHVTLENLFATMATPRSRSSTWSSRPTSRAPSRRSSTPSTRWTSPRSASTSSTPPSAPSPRPTSSSPTPPTPSSSASACVPRPRPRRLPSATASRSAPTASSTRPSRTSTPPASACSSPPRRSTSPAPPRSATPSRCPRSASPRAAWSPRARSRATTACASCATASWSTTASSRPCAASRTTSRASRPATSAAWASRTTRTSTLATSSRATASSRSPAPSREAP